MLLGGSHRRLILTEETTQDITLSTPLASHEQFISVIPENLFSIIWRQRYLAKEQTEKGGEYFDKMVRKVFGEALMAYGYVSLWIVLSGAVITYNKFLLAVSGFPYPITLTLWCEYEFNKDSLMLWNR